MINIEGLPKAQVLAELYNHAAKPSFRVIQQKSSVFPFFKMLHEVGGISRERLTLMFSSRDMKASDAEIYLDQNDAASFHTMNGRHLHVDLSRDEFDARSYDQCNGEGTAKRVIQQLRLRLGIAEPEPFRNLATGWFDQYSELESRRAEQERSTQPQAQARAPSNNESEQPYAGLARGWFSQYSAQEPPRASTERPSTPSTSPNDDDIVVLLSQLRLNKNGK